MKLFISYSRDDKQWVYEFARRVSSMRARHEVWYDQDLHVSQKWWDEILNRIEWCEATIVILTPRYVNSPFCMTELEYALALNKPIMPLRMKECEIPDALKPIQYLDIEALDMNEILIEIASSLGDIRAELGNFPPPSVKPARPSVPPPQEAVSSDPFELFAAVHQAAELGDLVHAEKLAQRLKEIDQEGFGLEIDAYLNERRLGKAGMSAYLNIAAYVEAGQMHEARIAWKVYIRQYGRLNYDPKGYATTLSEIVVVSSAAPTPKQTAETTVGTRITDDKGVVMVYVPSGKFLLGSRKEDDGANDNEKSQREFIISHPFWLDLTPVTNVAYAQFIKAQGYHTRALWTLAGWKWLQDIKHIVPEDSSGFTTEDQPRVGVTWHEADAYCRWRGGRLPTEGEWEWAARGEQSLIYPWGNTFDPAKVVWSENSGGMSARVGSKLAGSSWVGALDMSGNVWEWTSSQYLPYLYKEDDGRKDQIVHLSRPVVRGGSWNCDLKPHLRSTYRTFFSLNHEGNDVGFRCVRSY